MDGEAPAVARQKDYDGMFGSADDDAQLRRPGLVVASFSSPYLIGRRR